MRRDRAGLRAGIQSASLQAPDLTPVAGWPMLASMDTPEGALDISTIEDVTRLIEGGLQEDLHLEYKSGRITNKDRFKEELAKDVSAFANSDGGTLIIGVAEQGNRPVEIDGIDTRLFGRESLGQTLHSKVRPIIPGLRIREILGRNCISVLVVLVPKSDDAPHQGPDCKYYRRYEHHNQPLQHHEIEDLRRRRTATPPLVVVSTATRGGILTAVDLRNPGEHSADNVIFEFSSGKIWPNDAAPAPLARGIQHLHPGQHIRFRGRAFHELYAESEETATYSVRVEYTHSALQKRVSHTWPLDFEAYRESMSILSDEQQDRRDLNENLKKISDQVAKLTGCVQEHLPRAIGANGLDLSVYTLRNLRRIISGSSIEKLKAHWFNSEGLCMALSIDQETARHLEGLLRTNQTPNIQELKKVAGVDAEVLNRFIETFCVLDIETSCASDR